MISVGKIDTWRAMGFSLIIVSFTGAGRIVKDFFIAPVADNRGSHPRFHDSDSGIKSGIPHLYLPHGRKSTNSD